MLTKRKLWRAALALAALALAVSIVVPFVSAERFRTRVEMGLERALHRDVSIGDLRFSMWGWPGFTLTNVVIADLPEVSAEPFAYVNEARARIAIASLWRGEIAFSSITLSQPSVNIAQGPSGAWNYEQMLRSGVGAGRRVGGALPELVVRDGRINFRSGLKKSIYYFRSADLRLAEEEQETGAWLMEFRAEPARTDSFAPRFGTIRGRGRWRAAAGNNGELDVDLEIERSPLSELASLFRASSGGLSGFLSARAHLSGPAEALEVRGNLELSERGEWGIFALRGDTARVPLRGLLNLPARRLHLEASPAVEPIAAEEPASLPGPAASAELEAVPAAKKFEAELDLNPEFAPGEWLGRVAFAGMPVDEVIGMLRYLDDSFPDYPELEGSLSGEVGYRSAGGLRGAVNAEELLWQTESKAPFALKQIQVRLEGDAVAGEGRLDLDATLKGDAGQEPTGDERDHLDAAAAPAAEGVVAALPSFAFALERRTGRLNASLEGRRITAAHLDAIRQLAPLAEGRPPLLDGDRWHASGRVNWQRSGFRDRGGWHGQLVVRGLSAPVNGIASPVLIGAAPLQLGGRSWKVTGATAKVGGVPVRFDATAEEPGSGFPATNTPALSLALWFDELSLTQLQEQIELPLADSRGFISRTFSPRSPAASNWLRTRVLVAKVYIKKVLIEESKYYDFRGDLYWNGSSLEVRNISLQSRFGLMQAQLRAKLDADRPQWAWTVMGRNPGWRSGEIEIRGEFSATGNLESVLGATGGSTEISWRRPANGEMPLPSVTRLSLRWLPGVEEPTICAQCVELRMGTEVAMGDCDRGNSTTYRCQLEDPRTGQKHEINLPISLFGSGAN
ncbi:MAG: AsmA family protein [Bryobacterales bacterium]|nr:AsmA family protein [Bryobacterales bacterium]